MLQRKLLTSHPGSIHGGEETPGGQPSLRQGAGKRSSGAPDLGSAAAAEKRRDREKGFCLRGFRVTENIWAKGAARGDTRGPGGPWRGPTLGRAERAPGALVGPLWPLLGDSRSFRSADFLLDFPKFLEQF